jgi:hypothetical protein
MEVQRQTALIPVSQEALDDAADSAVAFRRWMDATPEQRIRWTREAEARRRELRRNVPAVPLTMDGLLDKLGFSREYAVHLVQPYCACGDSYDGWERCAHANDLELR